MSRYRAANPPRFDAQLPEVLRYLTQELQGIQAAINAVAEGRFDVNGAEPGRPREGQLAFANGSDWDPGYGAGFYEYTGSEWRRLMGLAGASALLALDGRTLTVGHGTAQNWADATNDGQIEVGARGTISAIGGGITLSVGNNCYNDGTGWKYIATAPATLFNQNQSGNYFWYVAASGTAGTAITFTEAMNLSNAGVLTARFAVVLKRVSVTFGASITIDANDGNFFNIVAGTAALAYTMNAPTNPADGQMIQIRIANSSGGALGAATWNAVFKMTAWVNPANGFSRTIHFHYNGTNWVEVARTAADVPN